MAYGAHLAGKAINITKTTGPHALSYALTMNHDIPHGYAVILTLPGFFIHNANVTKDRINPRLSFKDHQKRISELCELLQAGSNEDAVEKIQRMVRDAGLSTKLSKAGVENKQELEKVVDSVNLERLRNNPAVVSKNDLRLILQTAY